MRQRMEGRLLVVQLLCRDVAAAGMGPTGSGIGMGVLPSPLLGVFTPCVAFRVAGSPTRYITNVSEVLFAPDARSSEDAVSPGLTTTEYIAIGISSVLLGLIYVASVFLYLHIKKRRAKSEGQPEENISNTQRDSVKVKRESVKKIDKDHLQRERHVTNMISSEDGIVKSNPLLDMSRHFHEKDRIKEDFLTDSDGCQTDENDIREEDEIHEDHHNTHQITSVTVHPMVHVDQGRKLYESYYRTECYQPREESGIERLPEENVSIIETFDMRDDKPETVPIGNARRKLYFNPAYFEPHLLLAPPPAAIEFLIKIREVISIAKHKMVSKRFTPSLGGIPEEDVYQTNETALDFYHIGSQRSSAVSLKRENIRRKPFCSGCPGCERRNFHDMSPFNTEISPVGVCHNCSSSNGLNKQVTIRKWLEGVPMTKSSAAMFYESIAESRHTPDSSTSSAHGMLNSLLSLPKDNRERPRKYYNFTSRSLYAEDSADNFVFKKKTSNSSVRSEPAFRTFNIPLPSFSHHSTSNHKHHEDISTVAKIKDIRPIGLKLPIHKNITSNTIVNSPKLKKNHAMPDMINEALAIDKHVTVAPTKFKNKRNATEIINAMNKKVLENDKEISNHITLEKQISTIDYETDSLERGNQNRGFCTPTEYADISSSQASPSLSTALPMDEELTMRNAIYKMNSGSRPTSRISNSNNDDTLKSVGLYEPVENEVKVVKNAFDNHIYSLPDVPTETKTDYSLVSEVYVNNGYNFGSTPTTPSESDYSTFGKRKPVIRYAEPNEKPGQLTIEVKDSPENYIKIHESDGFEPDTLDRKPNKMKITPITQSIENDFVLSSKNIMDIKTTGLFQSSSLSCSNSIGDAVQSKRSFGSLKEIYETKNYNGSRPSLNSIKFHSSKDAVDSQDYEIIENVDTIIDSDEGRILTLESRHCKRQRQSTPPNLKSTNKPAPPDVVPFEETNIYEYPKPPRKVEKLPPPLPPKNEYGRSPSSRRNKINNVIVIEGKKGRAPSPPLRLLPGPSSPSGASVHSSHSSDYENIIPEDDVHNKLPQIPRRNIDHIQNEESIQISNNGDVINCGKISCVPLKSTPKSVFREFQTPKAGRKIKNLSPKKPLRDRSGSIKKLWKRGIGNQYKEDSGYLSTDSNDSRRVIKRRLREAKISGSETDESVEDARSESGAESVETHSVFFGSFRKLSNISNSADSGRSSDDRLRNMVSPLQFSVPPMSDCDDMNIVNVQYEPKTCVQVHK